MKHILQQIGLTESETKVYLALLDLGDSTRGDIVHTSGIAGSKVYEVLEKLQTKGLVTIYTKDKVSHFKPANPKQLLYYLEEKEQKVKQAEHQVNTIMAGLMEKYKGSATKPEVELLTGFKGLEILFREQVESLKKGEYNYVIGGTRGAQEQPVVAFFQKIHAMREKKGIKTKMLYNIKQKESATQDYGKQHYPGSTTRFIQHTSPVSINVYKNRVFITVWTDTPITIHIRSQDVANSFLEYFEILWKQSKA
ncbi:hypothetical protein CMO91_03850 [Candidatus Woesearchaeota archaeon]|nr:hypothetical protein [Candidatus Woesearchaeota archaeon]